MNYIISIQGKIMVNDPFVIYQCENIVLVSLDLKSKYAELDYIGADNNIPFVILKSTESTINENQEVSLGNYTEIQFPDLDGWDIWATSIGGYTLNICFVKEKE